MAEELQAQVIEAVNDRSNPAKMRIQLGDYFRRKQYVLQHKRYKLLTRWAHHALRSRNIDPIAQQASFRLGKMQWEFDSTVKRAERLSTEDDYLKGLDPNLRPTSRSK